MRDKDLDRGVSFETTFDGAGVLRGDLTPQCAAMVQAVLDALSAPAGAGICGPGRSGTTTRWPRRCAGCWPRICCPGGPGSRSRRWSISRFADLCQLDAGSALQDAWIAGYRARWAAHRAAASVSHRGRRRVAGRGQARAVACDAMIIPVVTGDIDPGAVEELIALCVCYHRLRTTPSPAPGTPAATATAPRTARSSAGSAQQPGGSDRAAPPSRPG